MSTEVVAGMSYADYAARPGLRASYLAAINRASPGVAEYQRTHETDTPAMRWGTALHTMILEPERFANEYTIGGPVNPKTQQPYGSETVAFAKWAAEQQKPILTREEHRLIVGMADAIAAHPLARTIRDAPRKTELSLFWTLDDGTPCKARIDCLQDGVLWDIKTCRCAKRHAFHGAIASYGYHLKAAWYLDGACRCGLLKPDAIVRWLAVENAAPYALAVYRCGPMFLDLGHIAMERALATIGECRKANVWPAAYSQDEIVMEPEKWMEAEMPDVDLGD
jgi:hypothetical protein